MGQCPLVVLPIQGAISPVPQRQRQQHISPGTRSGGALPVGNRFHQGQGVRKLQSPAARRIARANGLQEQF